MGSVVLFRLDALVLLRERTFAMRMIKATSQSVGKINRTSFMDALEKYTLMHRVTIQHPIVLALKLDAGGR